MPPGRGGIQPSIALQYNSEHANGWVGVGWDLDVSHIEVDTRFGVPELNYAGTQTYLLDGAMLVPVGTPNGDGQEFQRRVEGRFDRIVRHGDGPTNFWWEITDKRGTVYTYGHQAGDAGGQLADPHTGPGSAPVIARWYLETVRDLFGNTLRWTYSHYYGTSGSEPSVEMYPDRVDYTSFEPGGIADPNAPATYAVTFARDSNRSDTMSNARFGFDVRIKRRLSQIDVVAAGQLVRSYRLNYAVGEFDKSALASVQVYGSDGTSLFYQHDFEYYRADRHTDATKAPSFSDPQIWGEIDDASLQASSSAGGGVHAFLGVGVVECDPFHVGGGGTVSVNVNVGQNEFEDVDGDGLPDVLASGDLTNTAQAGIYLWRNGFTTGSTRGTQGEFTPTVLYHAPGELSGTVDGDLSLSLGTHLINELGAGGYDFTWNATRTYTLFTDIEGDGRPDLVRIPNVLDAALGNSTELSVFLNPYTQGSSALRFGTDGSSGHEWNYQLNGMTPPTSEMAVDPGVAALAAPWFHRTDPLLRWTAEQLGGDALIAGEITLPADASADGVLVSIVKAHGALGETDYSQDTIWSRVIAPGETCVPAGGGNCGTGLPVDVKMGDRLFFTVDALDAIERDVVAWHPTVTFTKITEADCKLGCNPLIDASQVAPFDWGSDFRLADPNLVGWSASVGGTVAFAGTVHRPSGGSVHARLIRRRTVWPNGMPSAVDPTGQTTPYDSTLARQLQTQSPSYVLEPVQETGQICDVALDSTTASSAPFNCTLAVERGDEFILSVTIPSGQDPALYAWGDATATYQSVDWQTQANQTPVNEAVGACDPDPPAGSSTVPNCQVGTEHSLPKAVIIAPVFLAIGDRAALAAPSASNEGPKDPLVGFYRGWSVGEWNGGSDGSPTPFSEAGLHSGSASDVVDIAESMDPNIAGSPHPAEVPHAAPMLPAPDGVDFPDPTPLLRHGTPMWRGAGVGSFVSATEMRPSRIGGIAFDKGSGAVTDYTDRLGHVWHAPGLRASTGTSQGVNFTLAVIGDGAVEGRSQSDLEMIDMDGDRRPDSVSLDPNTYGLQVQRLVQTGPQEGHFDSPVAMSGWQLPAPPASNANANHLREHHTLTYRTTVGLGSAASAIAQRLGGGSGLSAALAVLPSWGDNRTQSATMSDLIDINGDGLPDRVTVRGSYLYYQLNLGRRFGIETAMAWPAHDEPNTSPFTDVTWATGAPVPPQTNALHNETAESMSLESGGGYHGVSWGGGVTISSRHGLWRLMDVNGDGLPDQVSKTPETNYFTVRLNLGNGFGAAQQWSVTPWEKLGDKFDTLTYSVGNNVSQTLGYGGSVNIAYLCLAIEASLQTHAGTDGTNGLPGTTNQAQLLFQDIDGDGTPDHILKRAGDPAVYVRLNPTGRANLLRHVSRPFGGSFDLEYAREGNRVGTDAEGNPADMPHNQWVLSAVTSSDGQGNSYHQNFEYFGSGVYDRDERESYGFGHVRTIVHAGSDAGSPVATKTDVYYHNQDYYRRGLTYRVHTEDAAGQILGEETTQYAAPPEPVPNRSFFPADQTHTTSFYEGGDLVRVTTVTREYDAAGNLIRLVDTGDAGAADDVVYTLAYKTDAARHVYRVERIDAGDPATPNAAPLRRRTATYDDQRHFELTAVTDMLVGGRDPDTGLEYDGLATGVNPTWQYDYDVYGNVHTATDPSGFVLTYDYDATAHQYRTRIEDSFGYASTATVDLRWAASTSTLDTNGQSEIFGYDIFGRPSWAAGPGDSISDPTVTYAYSQGSVSTTGPSYAVTDHKDTQHATDPIETVTFVDGLARVIQTKKDAVVDVGGVATVGRTVSGLIEWDALGRVAYRSQPTFETVGSRAPTQLTPVVRTRPIAYQYDSQSRVIRVDSPDGQHSTMAYSHEDFAGVHRLTTTVTDPLGHARMTYRTMRGEVVGVREHNTVNGTAQYLWTRYSYDRFGRLTSVTDADGNVTTADYDSRGLLVALDNPDTGLTEYAYTLAGDLGAKQTPNLRALTQPRVIHYLRDYHRLREIDAPDETPVVYTYGAPNAPNHAAGRVVQRQDESGTIEYQYGPLGEVLHTHQVLAGQAGFAAATVDLSYTFDSFGRMLSLTYPDNERVEYGYDAGGQLQSVLGYEGTLPTTHYVDGITYDEFGARRSIAYGNGVTTRYAYDENMRWLRAVDSDLPGNHPLQRLSFGYDDAGRLTAASSSLPGAPNAGVGGSTTQLFWYDELGQLDHAYGLFTDSASQEHEYTLQMAYDAVGNITHQTQTDLLRPAGATGGTPQAGARDWAYAYAGPRPHAPTQVGDRTLSYDANGNQTHWVLPNGLGERTVEWTAHDRVRRVTDDNERVTEFRYDADGNRTHKMSGESFTTFDAVTMYAGQFYTLRNGADATKHVFAGDTRVASTLVNVAIPGDTPRRYWYHSDQLQSVQYVTDESGQAVEHAEYFPFGDSWVDESVHSDRVPYRFNGKEMDQETGLYDFGARMYDPRVGQWLSPDPILASYFENESLGGVWVTQNLWAYSYSYNSPILLRDPDGNNPLAVPAGPLVGWGGRAVAGVAGGVVAVTVGWAVAAFSSVALAYHNIREAVNDPGRTEGQRAVPGFSTTVQNTSDDSGPPAGGPPPPTVSGGSEAGQAASGGESSAEAASSGTSASPAAPQETHEVILDGNAHPQAAQHIEDAVAAGHPEILTIDRPGAEERRRESLHGVPTQPGLDRDEYPPAVAAEGGHGASVRPIPRGDNRGAGASMGHQIRSLPNGARFRIRVVRPNQTPPPSSSGGNNS